MSSTLQKMLSPLTTLMGVPANLASAIRKTGKRGNGTYYPNDLARNSIRLECLHDVTGRVLFADVVNGDFSSAISHLSNLVQWEDSIADIFENDMSRLYA